MTPPFTVQGWCPGALRPMMSGDGLVVRVRPPGGRLTAAQASGLADAAQAFGNGLIDLSARASLQLRGVAPAQHPALIARLQALRLVDADPLAEARGAVLVTPFADARTDALAAAVSEALLHGPDLPGKFGFAVDTGPAPLLRDTPADIRLERDVGGGLILRCDGAALGAPVTAEGAGAMAVALAHWFVAAGGASAGRGRMAALTARGVLPGGRLAGRAAPAPAADPPGPGLVPAAFRVTGALVGFAFGQTGAATLAALAAHGDIRLTPWRMLLLEGVQTLPDLPGLILSADDPLRRVQACTGAPGCVQALRAVRPLARLLAPQVPEGRVLHVSGCAKGCAHPLPADVTLVATAAGFDLIAPGSAQYAPQRTLPPDAAMDLKGLF